MKKKMLFLFLKTGGGHLAPARALARTLGREQYGECEPILIDGLSRSPRFLRVLIEDGYAILQERARWLYGLLYLLDKFSPLAHFHCSMVGHFVRPYLEEEILSHTPAQITIFHFFLIEPTLAIIRRHGLRIPVTVVVTDPYTAHPVWFRHKDQQYVVFSERLREYAISMGLAPYCVKVIAGVVDDAYSHPVPTDRVLALRKNLAIEPWEKVVLLIGGSDGIPNGVRLVHSLCVMKRGYRIVAVCGKNARLRQRLGTLQRRYQWQNLSILGFVDNVQELLTMADIVVSKCGASIMREVLLTKKILVVHRYLWEQEKGNVDYLVHSRIGLYERRPRSVASRIEHLLEHADAYYDMVARIERAGVYNGVGELARYILSYRNEPLADAADTESVITRNHETSALAFAE